MGYVDGSNCYDLAPFVAADRTLHFVVNNRTAEVRSDYLAAVVVRTHSGRLKGINTPYFVEYDRNGNEDKSVPAKWARIDLARTVSEGSLIPDALIVGAFRSPDGLPVKRLEDVDPLLQLKVEVPDTIGWHAWMVEDWEGGGAKLLVEDTRNRIQSISIAGIELESKDPPLATVRFHLKKFASSANPSPPHDIIDVGVAKVHCVYVRFNLNGAVDPVLGSGTIAGDYFAGRVADGADC